MAATRLSERDAKYRFGDSDLAAQRLRLLAKVFAPSTREFLEPLRACHPQKIVDLGCGPGHTTRLLAEAFPEATVLGLDNSTRFVELANGEADKRISFQVANATEPLPDGPYDLIYCRYLLTHLPQPLAAIQLWSEQLRPSGLIAIEENDWIRTTEPAFEKYVQIVEAMLAAGGQRLYVGAELASAVYGLSLRVKSSELIGLDVSSGEAARMFRMNIESWRNQPFVIANYSLAAIEALADNLQGLAEQNSPTASIIFGRRRLLLEKIG